MSIKDLPTAARPREKLLQHGAASLADAELLALLLRTGVRGQGVLQLAEGVLARMGGYAGLLQAGADDLKGIKGLGPAKRAELAAVVEMARRALAQRLADAPVFDAPQMVKDYLQLHLGGRLLWITAACGQAAEDLTRVGLQFVEQIAYLCGCDQVGFDTRRPGLVRKARRLGYFPESDGSLRKALT